MKSDYKRLLIIFTIVLFVGLLILALLQTKLRARERQKLGLNSSNVQGASDTDPSLFAPQTSDDMTKLGDISKMLSTFTFGEENDPTGTPTTGGPTGGTANDAEFASRMGPPNSVGYSKMPDPVTDEYVKQHGDACSYGNAALLNLINQVSAMWKAKYPDSRIEIWDVNASGGHASHTKGVDVDIAITNESAANMCSAFYNQPGTCGGSLSEGQCRSIELGKMFLSSNIVQMIFYDDLTVDDAITTYAHQNNKTNFILIEPWGTQACDAGHHNHFHVRIMDSYILPVWAPPGC